MRICNEITSLLRPSSGERTFINRGLRLANRRVMREEFGMRPHVKQVCTFCNPLSLSVFLSVCLFVCLSPSTFLSPPFSLPSYDSFISMYLRINYVFFQAVLLITDGRQTHISNPNEPTPVQVSTAIKSRGIEISAIGIGAADAVELWDYASKPENTLLVNDFSVLRKYVSDTRKLLLGPGKWVVMLEWRLITVNVGKSEIWSSKSWTEQKIRFRAYLSIDPCVKVNNTRPVWSQSSHCFVSN